MAVYASSSTVRPVRLHVGVTHNIFSMTDLGTAELCEKSVAVTTYKRTGNVQSGSRARETAPGRVRRHPLKAAEHSGILTEYRRSVPRRSDRSFAALPSARSQM